MRHWVSNMEIIKGKEACAATKLTATSAVKEKSGEGIEGEKESMKTQKTGC